jgi:hypothetical protein
MIISKKIVKAIVRWTLPEGFCDVVRRVHKKREILDRKARQTLASNHQLKDVHNGERCFILATGPSINKQNLKLLRGEKCIAVSNFFLHPDYNIIKPYYYCVAQCHSPVTEEAWQAWISEMADRTIDAAMFFSLKDQPSILLNGNFMNRKVFYLKFGESWDGAFVGDIDITRPLPLPQSVTLIALVVALYLGFRNIHLLGCDHDGFLHVYESRHFYDENKDVLVKKGYNEWYQRDLGEQFRAAYNLWLQYKVIRAYAQKNGINIYNATEGGYLDVFPRVDFSSLFE